MEDGAFYTSIAEHTSKILMKITTEGVGSLDSLVTIIRCLGKTNKVAITVLKRLNKSDDNNKNDEMRELLFDFCKYNEKIVEFLNAIEEWLNGGTGISPRLEQVKSALRGFKAKKSTSRGVLLETMRGFMVANKNADDTLYAKFKEVFVHNQQLCERLRGVLTQFSEHDLERVPSYRKMTTIILRIVYVGMLVWAVAFALLSISVAPAFASAVSFAPILDLNIPDPLLKLLDHLWDKYEEKLKSKPQSLEKQMMFTRDFITMEDLENIEVLIQELQEKIHEFSSLDDVEVVKDPVVKSMIKEVERKIDEFARAVKDLQKVKDKLNKKVMSAKNSI